MSHPTSSTGTAVHPQARSAVSPAELHDRLRDGAEIAVLDVREQPVFVTGHLVVAVPVPRSRLEILAPLLVPRRSTRVVVVDGDGGELAREAARVLTDGGYTAVTHLDGGVDGWRAAGLELITGASSLYKAFGEFVLDTYAPPEIEARELAALLDSDEDVLVVDSRTLDEFTQISIPGAVSCPSGELVLRVFGAVRSPAQQIVVNCAGRTRGILGAQVLINAGLPNPVRVLRDGTAAWEFAGLEPGRGARTQLAAPTASGLAAAVAAARRLRERFGVRTVDHATVDRYRADPDRTLYLLDVRDPVEYAAGHLPGSRSVPGGQLLQTFDEFVGTFRARIVLLDGPDGVRASSAAAWLAQLGLDDVEILVDAFAGRALEYGPEVPPPPLGGAFTGAGLVPPAAARRLLDDGAVLVDVGPSDAYRAAHAEGARFASRAGLAGAVRPPTAAPLVLTSADGVLAGLAAADLARDGATPGTDLFVLDGGNAAWRAAGLPLTDEPGEYLTGPDGLYPEHRDLEAKRAFYADYVRWGRQAAAQVARDGVVTFRTAP